MNRSLDFASLRSGRRAIPPCAKRGEVAPSYGDGGVMSRTDAVAYDPSDRVRRGHLPGFAREEI